MNQGIRFDPNARKYDLDTLKKAFDPSFAAKLEQTVTVATAGDRDKILEDLALRSEAHAINGISPKRGQQALELHRFISVKDVVEAHSKEWFSTLPTDIRKACERAWDLAREATINY